MLYEVITGNCYLLSVFCLLEICGGVPERSKGTDCKSVGSAFGGSNPPPSTITLQGYRFFESGNSSMVEHQPSKLRVAGSSLVSRSIFFVLHHLAVS